MKFTEKDLKYIKQYGLTPEKVSRDAATIINGIPSTVLYKAAIIGQGIEALDDSVQEKLVQYYDKESAALDIVKFVPASGAATRLFKTFQSFLSEYNYKTSGVDDFLAEKHNEELNTFFSNLEKLPFYPQLHDIVEQRSSDYKSKSKGAYFYLLVNTMLNDDAMGYADLPKGLIPFHKYKDQVATPFEEQLKEAAAYASSKGLAKVHFTVSKAHESLFKNCFDAINERLSKKTATSFKIGYSYQKKETDTLAMGLDGTPFRDENGNLLFRPAGHGALIENLNEIDADLVFIKNVDNLSVDKYLPQNAGYKKMLAGKLVQLQTQIFDYLRRLEK
ncbi:MAG: DUF4301 family protein, partial [Flavobacteriaceae bacterium]|nr:DUF4301 family protein [Flavobacteriaceae bacterium]